jgi:hypothetical protein
MLSIVEDDEVDDSGGLVPYAPDFTPATLGRKIGAANVLTWLLTHAKGRAKADLANVIARDCLAHIAEPKDRRDMASHVVQALQNYHLVEVDDAEVVSLTTDGRAILGAPAAQRDEAFARHILTVCNGYRLVEEIQRLTLGGQRATLEALTEVLDRASTSKSISSMKAWLERAGVLRAGRSYQVDDARLDEVLGNGATRLLGLDERQLEFILAARVLSAQHGTPVLEAADVKALAESRRPGVRLPSKALGAFARSLVEQGFFSEEAKVRTKGGTRVALRFSARGLELTDDQLRGLVGQASGGLPIGKLLPVADVVAALAAGTINERGHAGEMLAVHACLLLGLRVVSWRSRAPAEIDLIAERTMGLSYQRWHVQVKNTDNDLDVDRVDREIGVAAGTGATHILFVVPRAGVSQTAQAELDAKTRLTHLQPYVLSAAAFDAPVQVGRLLRELRGQEARQTRIKRMEAERRERAG